MNNEPLATVVVTPRERYAVARRALESVVANTPEKHKLVYVAGGAPAAIQDYLAAACAAHGYDLILRPDFLPPNAARNLGLQRAATKYLVFIENDVVVEPGWLSALLRCAEEEEADVVSPLCLIGEPAERNAHSVGGMLMIEQRGGQQLLRERHHVGPICLRTDPRRLDRMPSDYSEFHCALVRRSVLERTGPLDEQVTGAAEHIDLALHLRAMGGRGFAEPAAVVSYLPESYTLGDLDTYTRRWSPEWYFPTMTHLAGKWALASDSPFFHDYLSSFHELRERCFLGVPAAQPTELANPAQSIVQLLDQMETSGYSEDARLRIRDVYFVATELFAGVYRASGRTLLSHLVGTAGIAAAFGANPAVIAAGLLHAAYALGRFPSGFDAGVPTMRRWLRRRVGDSVETLVYVYSLLQPDEVAQYLADLDRMPVELANAVLVRIANGIEDRAGGDHRYFDSAAWLRSSNALIEQWMPAFTAVAQRLGVDGMTYVLRDAVASALPEASGHALRPGRPLNYTVRSANGELEPVTSRNLLAAPSEESRGLGNRIAKVKRRAIKPLNEGSVRRESRCSRIVADARPWAFSAYAHLEDLVDAHGPAILEIRLQVERGTLGVMVLERGSWNYQLVPEQSVAAGAEPVTLRFEIAAIEEAGEIVFRNWPSEDGAADARIFEIRVTGRP